MSERSERLRAHVEAAQGKPVIGVDDCGPWVAAWIEKACGRKVALPRYASSAEGYALAAAAGGLVDLVSPLLTAIGLWETQSPELGDVGIVRLSDRDTAVIFCGNDIAVVRDERGGARYLRVRQVLKAWGLPQ